MDDFTRKFDAVQEKDAEIHHILTTVYAALEDCIRAAAPELLREASLFDIYRGPGIPSGQKSVAFSLALRADDRSLTSEEADAAMKDIVGALEAKLGARLR